MIGYNASIRLSYSDFLSIRVQGLFSWRPGDMSSPQPSFFSFKSLIENSKLKVRIYFIWQKGDKRKENGCAVIRLPVT